MSYRSTYFRIDSHYRCHHDLTPDWLDIASRDDFRNETRRLFQSGGWTLHTEENDAYSDTVTRGQEDLYLHPMNFSGVIMQESIPELEALLAQAKTFRCSRVDCYEEYLDLSDEAYWARLESQRDEITAEILRRYKTKSKNLYVTNPIGLSIAKQFSVNRLCDKQGNRNKANLFVSGLVSQLIADGRLVTANTRSGPGIRTATKEELKPLAKG